MVISTIYKLMLCHFLGDYVFQTDFLAKTKSENWWHMLAHCVTYTAPFIYFFGLNLNIAVLFLTHLIIDSVKARYKKINYVSDQILHVVILGIYLI